MSATDLDAARELARAGVPLFMAPPDPQGRTASGRNTGYALPPGWERGAVADPTLVDQLPEGWALCAAMGGPLDLVDLDPRGMNGAGLPQLPPAVARARTPSGGTHLFVVSLGLPSLDGVVPGLDYKGGDPLGEGRGFAFIAPTVRVSKVDGLARPYGWTQPPQASAIEASLRVGATIGYDGLRAAIAERRAVRGLGRPRRVPRSVAAREWDAALARLEADLRYWASSGWGGAAHAGLLAHTTHLARLAPDYAEGAYLAAFAAAGLEPDDDDLAKLASALERSVPDVVVDDSAMSGQELFWHGADRGGGSPKAGPPPDPIGRASAGPFEFLTEDEAAAIPMPDPVVDALLFRGTKARLFGESTAGKTWVAMDLAACVANGLPWLGRFATTEGPALFVAAEGAPSFAPRMRTWGLASGRRSMVKFWPEAVLIGGPQWDAFVQACEREGFVLVVQDTQAAMTVGRKEDSNDDAGEVQAAWTALCASAGAPCSLSVHHVGWADQGRPRGASGMFGGMDTELRLTEGRHGLLLVTEKQRYHEKAPPVHLRLVKEHGGLVVRPPLGEDGGVFADEHDVLVAALTAKLTRFVETGGSVGRGGYRTIYALLNKELRGARDEPVSEAVAQDVARAYRRTTGVEV